jgi:hypothetical protein
MTIGLIVPPEVVAQLSPSTRAELLSLLPSAATQPPLLSSPEPAQDTPDEELVRFSVPQARRFLAGLGTRSYEAAVWIAGLPEPTWTYSEFLNTMGMNGKEIRVVGTALTRRARTVTGDNRKKLKTYSGSWSRPESMRGRIHPDTQAALRIALAG